MGNGTFRSTLRRARAIARGWESRLGPWRPTLGVLAAASAGALLLATAGLLSPWLAAIPSVLAFAVGVPSAVLYSLFLVIRARRLDPSFRRRETRRLSLLVVFLVLLVPANLVPTRGKKWWLQRQGRAAVSALDRQFARTGYFPDRLGEVRGAPWLRLGLRYRSTGQDYSLSFEDPAYYFLDSGSWKWDRSARAWKYAFEDF